MFGLKHSFVKLSKKKHKETNIRKTAKNKNNVKLASPHLFCYT